MLQNHEKYDKGEGDVVAWMEYIISHLHNSHNNSMKKAFERAETCSRMSIIINTLKG
jgi:hypothetical protein